MQLKPPTTYDQQVQKLIDKGFIVEDRDMLCNLLHSVNYYCFSAYTLPYRDPSQKDKYITGISIKKVINTYCFDKKLSSLLYRIIGDIESYIKTVISYELSIKYNDPECYLKQSLLFNKRHNPDIYLEKIKEVLESNKNTDICKHHNDTYNGKFPFWVIINFFSFGMLSRFYSDLNNEDQKIIDNAGLQVGINQMNSWLKCTNDLRNKVCHFSRFYYWKFTSLPKNPVSSSNYSMDRTLFSQIMMLKFMYPVKDFWNNTILPELKKLIDEYSTSIELKHIGFPVDWEKLLIKE